MQAPLSFGGPPPKKQATNSGGGGGASTTPVAQPVKVASSTSAQPKGPSAFALMMAKAAEKPRKERYTLTYDAAAGGGSWSWDWQLVTEASIDLTSSWEGSVSIKHAGLDKPVAVQLATNVPPAAYNDLAAPDGRCKLSPSLLKSALQKAVRRGLATSAVRIAAELWRRNPQELIRRLLIIPIEDSTLHPAYPLLTWMMMATAAGYTPGEQCAAAVLSFVADVACCKWVDKLRRGSDPDAQATETDSDGDSDDGGSVISVASDHGGHDGGNKASEAPATATASSAASAASASKSTTESKPGTSSSSSKPDVSPSALDLLPPAHAALIRSIIARARYGGMGGDIRMLLKAAYTWKERLVGVDGESWLRSLFEMHGATPFSIKCGDSSSSSTSSSSSSSSNVPTPPYGSYKPRSAHSDGQPLTLRQVPFLRTADVPLAGVDFHCSDIIPELIARHPAAVSEFCKAALCGVDAVAGSSSSGDASAAEGALRRAMWSYRSGINVRQPLHGIGDLRIEAVSSSSSHASITECEALAAGVATATADPVGQAWAAIVEPLADQWARSFISARLQR